MDRETLESQLERTLLTRLRGARMDAGIESAAPPGESERLLLVALADRGRSIGDVAEWICDLMVQPERLAELGLTGGDFAKVISLLGESADASSPCDVVRWAVFCEIDFSHLQCSRLEGLRDKWRTPPDPRRVCEVVRLKLQGMFLDDGFAERFASKVAERYAMELPPPPRSPAAAASDGHASLSGDSVQRGVPIGFPSAASPCVTDAGAAIARSSPPSAPAGEEQAAAPAAPAAGQWRWLPPSADVPRQREGEWTENADGFSREESPGGSECFVAAVARGRSHKHDGLFCDDSFDYGSAGCWRIIAASDGAGSAIFSRVGSQLACDAVLRALKRELADIEAPVLTRAALDATLSQPRASPWGIRVADAFERGFAEAAAAIAGWVDERNRCEGERSHERVYIDGVMRRKGSLHHRSDPDDPGKLLRILEGDCNCTLLVAAYATVRIAEPGGEASDWAIVVSCAIGDGMISVFRRIGAGEPHAKPLMVPDVGQYAGQTHFLSTATAQATAIRERIRFHDVGRRADLVAVAAMTDGVADDYHEGASGMERLYCDLILNRALEVSATADEISMEAQWASEVLRRQAAEARDEMDSLATTHEPPCTPADKHRAREHLEKLKARAARRALTDLVAQETVLSDPRKGAVRQPLKYAVRYMEALGVSSRELLRRPGLLRAIADTAGGAASELSSTERPGAASHLFRWLNGYIVRGSFDDRAIVLFATGVRA